MKTRHVILIISTLLFVACTGGNDDHSRVDPVDQIEITSVSIKDSFWNKRIENNYRVSVINMFKEYEKRGSAPSPKLIEAAGYILQKNDDPELKAAADRGIDKLLAYLLPDGKPRKWKDLLNGEMYFAGHLMEAAIEYYKATDNRKILDAAIMLADDIDEHFGPGKRLDISQHEEVKIGLIKLYHYTGNKKYLDLAAFFMDERGHSNNGRELYGEYAQDHMPVVEQDEAAGHSVRATYLYSPLAELAVLTANQDYIEASDRLWTDVVHRKSYLTGHIGSYRDHEDIGEAYDLPALSCWNETCASIGNLFWNYQMFSLHRDARYADMMERLLYNAILPGVSLDGSEYFYQNPLKTFGGFERHPWFGPNCCPPNLARLLASIEKYIYACDENSLYINLFIGSRISTEYKNIPVTLTQESGFPWKGDIKLTIEPDSPLEFTVFLRIPGWTGKTPLPGDLYHYTDGKTLNVSIMLNGEIIKTEAKKGYVAIKRKWERGDIIELNIPMELRTVAANEKAIDYRDLIALERGPLVYCAEEIDNNGNIMNLFIPGESEFTGSYNENLLGGIVSISGNVKSVSRDEETNKILVSGHRLRAIPYFAWANRTAGEMSVWFATESSSAAIEPEPTLASGSTVSSSCGEGSIADNYPGANVPDIATRFYPVSQSGSAGFEALYDQVKPTGSFDGSSQYFSLRPQDGNEAWVQYDFAAKAEISSTSIYWKDDKQYCQVPESWVIKYRSGDEWVPVKNISDYTVDKDKFNTLKFEPVTTDAVRIEIVLKGLDFLKGELGPPDGNYMPDDEIWYETGIIEWQVSGPDQKI